MSDDRSRDQELFGLLAQFREERLSETDTHRLHGLLRQDATARAHYVQYLNLIAGLHWDRSADSRQTGQLPSIAPGPVRSPKKSRLPVRFSNLMPAAARQRTSAALWTVALAINAVLVFALALAVSPQLRGRIGWSLSAPVAQSPSKVSPARLISAVDCHWADDLNPPQSGDLLPGRELQLKSGIARIEFASGATIELEGPASFSPEAAGQGMLGHGRLSARVPKRAIGFTVKTPTATIVDLGTEFGVEVGDSGTTDVQVLTGQVQILTASTTNHQSSESAIILSAGSGRRIETNAAGEPVVREIDNSQRLGARRRGVHGLIYVYGALASSEWGKIRGVNQLIDGSGLKGDRHTNLPDQTMWHSAFDKVKNEYVLFDLGRPYRLDLMKVWNYNECDGATNELYRYLGVAQADIYVSSTSKGTPLDHPDDWQLVASDVKFDSADGTPNYSTPQLVNLGHVSARFVAIVIDDHFAPDPRPGAKQCVGLSEVQFFGSRVEASKPGKSE